MNEALFLRELSRSALFLGELLLANALFWYPFQRKKLFPLRVLVSVAVTLLGSTALFYFTEGSTVNNILSFVFLLILSMLFAMFCFDICWQDTVFCATAAYNVQFISSIIGEFIQRYFQTTLWPRQGFIIAVVYTIMYLVFGRRIKSGRNLNINRIFRLSLLIAAILTDIVICGTLRPFWLIAANRTMMVCSMILLLLCAVTTLILQFTLLNSRELSDELAMVEQLMKKEKAQYEFSKDTIDSINRKCHDMRHQIRQIGDEQHITPDAIHEMTDAIHIYDNIYKTGSHALDTILAEMSFYCQANDIAISCMADGKCLAFMRDTDIYSLFGNMLENAIQAVIHVPRDQRDIYLSVVSKGRMLSIHASNPYTGIVVMRNNLPATSNVDTNNHGIGTKSIQHIAEKYQGTVSFEAKDGTFHVYILIPQCD